jgi:hypothetical protein
LLLNLLCINRKRELLDHRLKLVQWLRFLVKISAITEF